MEFFLQVEPTHMAWTEKVPLQRKRTRYALAEDAPSARTLADIVAGFPATQWKPCSWTVTSGRKQRTRLSWCEVYLEHRLRQHGQEPEKAWLVVDWPADTAAPYHYYLAHLHGAPTKARCLKLSRSRWHIEQYFQRAKDDLGLDHFEGRSWRGFHHHLVLSAIAYLFILVQYLRTKKNFWCDVGAGIESDPALAGEGDRLLRLLRNNI
jgi:SRSO17 transposase